MKIIEPGHVYELDYLDAPPHVSGDPEQRLVFVNREPGHEHPGTQTQEVLRALIDRTYHCDHCMPHELNAMIVHHLRMALVFHEMRALERKAEKGFYAPEEVKVGSDGHFILDTVPTTDPDPNAAPRRKFLIDPPQPECRRRKY